MSEQPQQPQPAGNWNIANVLTGLRILLVPLFMVLLLIEDGHNDGLRWAAFAVFAVASATDRLDGDLARSRGLVTDLGKVFDPIADKALMGGALIGLSLIGVLWWWVTIVILVRELGITALRFAVIRHGVMPASQGGKLKTFLQAIGIGLLVMPLPDWMWVVAMAVILAAVVVTVVTGVDYVVKAAALRRESLRTTGAGASDPAAARPGEAADTSDAAQSAPPEGRRRRED